MSSNSFSEMLQKEAWPVWEEIFKHPFLREIRDGTLPFEKFRYYLIQDYYYMETFGRTVGLALSKVQDSYLVEELAKRVLTPIERPLHRQLLGKIQVSLDDLIKVSQSPTNLAYSNHLLTTGFSYGLGPTAAALLPCPWTYSYLGDLLGEIDHPLYSDWAAFYRHGFLDQSVESWRNFVDSQAEEANQGERETMRKMFLTSSRYELMFWEMAYEMEEWAP